MAIYKIIDIVGTSEKSFADAAKNAVNEAKKKDRQHWREICKLSLQPLPEKLKTVISQIYCAVTNEITQKEWFEGVPSLEETLKEIKEILSPREVKL
jgi:DNA-directed RNA polymerase specialized sigma subunit